MKARIIITPDGSINFYIDEGTFEEAKAKLGEMVADLLNSGIELTDFGKVEQHKHSPEEAHIHAQGESHIH